MTDTNAGPAAGRENAQRTYDRRRARSAADTLATIPPNRWDDATRRIIGTLATISAPSRIDDALEAFDGEPADHLVEITPRLFTHDTPVRWEDMPDGTDDLTLAFAAELNRMADEEFDDERERDDAADDATCRRQHQHGTPELAAACDALQGPFTETEAAAQRPTPPPYPDPRPRPDPDPRPRPEPHPPRADDAPRRCYDPGCTGLHVGRWTVIRGHDQVWRVEAPQHVHDNGDYRA